MRKITLLVCVVVASVFSAPNSPTPEQSRTAEHPFVIALPKMPLPSGGKDTYQAACLKIFDKTFFEVIPASGATTLPGDILIKSAVIKKGIEYDSLKCTISMVGGISAPCEIPFIRTMPDSLAEIFAATLLKIVSESLCGEAVFACGPAGMMMTFNTFNVFPPCQLSLPPGSYVFNSSYPGFADRTDTISVTAGKTVHKRVLLLPR
jgi:hypothetical protein